MSIPKLRNTSYDVTWSVPFVRHCGNVETLVALHLKRKNVPFNDLSGKRSINRGSYMSAHVLLNLTNELGKRNKMRGLLSILSFFCNKFNKFNNTKA